jgi:hypothetical protein
VAETLPELTEEEREALQRETTHKWSQPWMLYFMASTSGWNYVCRETKDLGQRCAPWPQPCRVWMRPPTTVQSLSIQRFVL